MTFEDNHLHLRAMQTEKKKLGFIRFVILVIVGFFWSITLYQTPSILNIMGIKYIRPLSTSFMRYNAFFHPLSKIDYRWVSSKNISVYLKEAVVLSEDDMFYEHGGLDWEAINRAARINWERKKLAFGASTISQQLAKNLYLLPSKDPIRKFREALLAIFLDNYLSKERILELYLNVVEWGPGIYGAEAASQHYFGISAKNISPSQAAFLASILPNPIRRGKAGFRMTSRAQSILRRIAQ